MVATPLSSNATLVEILHARAIRTPMDRLVIDVLGGALLMTVAVWARPAGWVVLTSAACCLLSFGAWAISERRLQPRPWPETVAREWVWRAIRSGAAFVGLTAFVVLLFSTLGLALGSIVS